MVSVESASPLKNLSIKDSFLQLRKTARFEELKEEFDLLEVITELEVLWKYQCLQNACDTCGEAVQYRKLFSDLYIFKSDRIHSHIMLLLRNCTA